MGEIRIKSGNLFYGELEQGSLGASAGQEYPTTTRVRTKKPGVNLQAGTYTIDCVGATGGVVIFVYNKDLSWDKESSSKNWKAMPLTFSLSSEKLVRFAFRKTGDSDILPSEVTDIQLLEGTYTSETIPEYQPYFLNRPAHQVTNGEWIDIPTHHYTNGRWQGELTSQSPLKFRADGTMLDWRIEGASGGVGDWDEGAQRYKIPVTVNGTITNIFTDHQLMDGDSIDYATDQTEIPIATGNNTLTVDTAVKPSKVFIKFEG